MRVIGCGVIDEFGEADTMCKKWISNWINDVRFSSWETYQDVIKKFPLTSEHEGNIVVFPIGLTEYCIKTKIAYKVGVVAVTWIGKNIQVAE